jgi:Uma2 family endonuclease
MASLPKTHLVTYEEWLEMPESEGREEVVNGEIIPMPPARKLHMAVLRRLVRALTQQLDEAHYEVNFGSYGLVIRRNPLTCREPDIAVFDRSSVDGDDGYYHSAPHLAIEILSPSETRRRTEAKLRDYESIGVPEVWILSPEGATVEVLYLENDRLVTARVLVDGILRPRALPDVAIDVESIWPN